MRSCALHKVFKKEVCRLFRIIRTGPRKYILMQTGPHLVVETKKIPSCRFLYFSCAKLASLTCMHTCSALVEAMVNKEVDSTYCADLFGDILGTSHVHEIPWPHPPSSQPGGKALFGDAQGTMLVQQRVRDLARQDTLDAACAARARKIRRVLRSLCDQLGDTSLEGFDARKKLDVIQKKNDPHGPKAHAGRRLLLEDVKEEEVARDSHMHMANGARGPIREKVTDESSQERQPDVLRKDDHAIHCAHPHQDAAAATINQPDTGQQGCSTSGNLDQEQDSDNQQIHAAGRQAHGNIREPSTGWSAAGSRLPRAADANRENDGDERLDAMADQDRSAFAADFSTNITHVHSGLMARVVVEGLCGTNMFSRVMCGDKLQVMIR
jgi:hypothetical protein